MIRLITLTTLTLFSVFFFTCILCSCSKGGNTPIHIPTDQANELHITDVNPNIDTKYRSLCAIYDLEIDSDTCNVSISSCNRLSSYHFPLSQFFPDVLQIVDYGFTPTFWADIRLKHPYPGSGIVGFDPRVIAILPANTGNEMFYPAFNVRANNVVVYQPDGYTKMYDEIDGTIAGNTNPYKCYFKTQPFRAWMSTGMTSETQRWYLNLNGFGGAMNFKLVVDVSTNYPDPPQPGVDNAPEPVQISATIGQGLTSTGGDAEMEVTLLDWHGGTNIAGVRVEAPSLSSTLINLDYSGPGQNPDEYIYRGTLTNSLMAPEGEYQILVITWDNLTFTFNYAEFPVTISDEIVFNPIDVTPPWINFSLSNVCADGNYAYLTVRDKGILILDTSIHSHPTWVKWLDTPGYAVDVRISGDHAYVMDGYEGMQIIDISSPESAYIAKTVVLPYYAWDVYVSGGYAYVVDRSTNLTIVDIDPLEMASVVKTVVLDTDYSESVFVADGFAYVAGFETGIHIIDVSTPESAHVVKIIDTPGEAADVYASDGYAYVSDDYNGLLIIDIDPLDTAFTVRTVYMTESMYSLEIVNGYAYVANGYDDLRIVDVSPPESAYIYRTVDIPGNTTDLDVEGAYAYTSTYNLQIIDINPPGQAAIVGTAWLAGDASAVVVSGDYAYISSTNRGLQIMDIDPPESASILNSIYTPGNAYDVKVSGNYAYIADSYDGLQIIDISSPSSASIIKTVDFSDSAMAVAIDNGYAYIANGDYYGGLTIIDVDPPETAHVLRDVSWIGASAKDVFVLDGYAYVANYANNNEESLYIIDIDPPISASIVKTVNFNCGGSVFVTEGYAYVTSDTKLNIIDIDPVEQASIVHIVDAFGRAESVSILNGYAYVSDRWDGLFILDITPPETAEVVASIETIKAFNACIKDNYAYLALEPDGFLIYKLW